MSASLSPEDLSYVRDYIEAADARVFHCRDNTGLEVDAVVETAGGRWAAFEVKLGAGQVEEASASLLKFADRVDTVRCGKPAALVAIAGSGFGYRREDGVVVVPVGALGP